jgi:adenine-specific DNA glycosylase
MTKSDAQRFTELTCSHKKDWPNCDDCPFRFKCKAEMPTYSNAADILSRMKEFCGEERFLDFIRQNGFDGENGDTIFIEIDLVLNPPALLKKAIEFLEVEK